MKQLFFILSIGLILFSCANEKKQTPPTQPTVAISDPAYQEGLSLITKSDCVNCHKPEETMVGPSYVAIAAKYPYTPETVSLLSTKIINGGVGVWGQVPMSAHPALTKEDASKMVEYILLLKK